MNRAEVRRRILAENDAAAASLKRRFDDAGTLVINLVSSPGAGKTSLLEGTVARLPPDWRAAAIVGDVATAMDADRLHRVGLVAHQIVTGGACHLDARMIAEAMEQTPFPELDVLFLENVGNLVCPASYDLGEDFKVVLLSVTEGSDKPFKYPAIFRRAAWTVITKSDLLEHTNFDIELVRQQVRTLNGGAGVMVTSVRTGEGIDEWCTMLTARQAAKATAARRRAGLMALPAGGAWHGS